MAKDQPIGFFDSGVGGISVLKKAMELLPHEQFIYYGDSKHAPYGDKDVETIKALSFSVMEELLKRGAKAVVVACNTATSVAIDALREAYKDIPIIGIEPALKVAIDHTAKGHILVLATKRTLKEKKFKDLLDRYKSTRPISTLALPGLVEIIEEGLEVEERSYAYLQKALDSIKESPQVVVLGCTHYPFVKPALRRIYPKDVVLLDGSEGTARRLKEVLKERGLLSSVLAKGQVTLLNSSDAPHVHALAKRLLAEDSDKML